ncbi:class II 3-deoxy-7-phosphoheptulonate synthase [Desulfuromonas acetoxidans]|uniref:Phospho-2-dehydro-3-deoxyheptonate aldolase n=1 Tax=Desulfuromonas acetoxidans (strain DSM 684 / 11070) TaxID=281689 RepID=Q1JWX2_DESA6|nr:3-deoxy-7-phosphoheptulonate synthase class II [Desulfuromonas acetoxidans]EAT14786.1 phospho-2-dehydro-3-deoxyheptonate aldolase [Desulfuromonas acetoxidans DSM 684]MBF0645859.1 3-deoxy-7-phosphoheptulonate synthase class II [Desulfuromonas acetoxidans]NVD25039.1 3-deoxy-7-phosphoheptulonate synthase class II [Desulfuromonas acetoxidans]NVE17084.1 3-deoxy-7-phosphoheptulonate synthase class II [Desulfuromonas acetoxidans]
MSDSPANWHPSSWHQFPAAQMPPWPDPAEYQETIKTISQFPPLVFAGEIRALKEILAKAAEGEAFLLQGGDCAENFSQCTAPYIRETLKVLLQMSIILTYAGGKPVAKVGRIAGQFAKPRSSNMEKIGDLEFPSFRGDMVNSPEFTAEARRPDPQRLIKGYYVACATMNLLRAFTKGGYAALHRVHAWNNDFVKNSPIGQNYEVLAEQISKALNFFETIGLDVDSPRFNQANVYTSHEALLLGYEEALTRRDSTTGEWYDCSAHMIWIGDRTRQLDGAHIEFFRGVLNPVGVKIGPSYNLDETLRLIEILNPENEPGRLTLITRFGAGKVGDYLPPLARAVKNAGHKVVWCCDPMHGNTYVAESGHKTRNFDDIMGEVGDFFSIHRSEGTNPGGVHLEMTGENVTECIGGGRKIENDHLKLNYATQCDPRLNAEQSLDLAFHLAQLVHG